MRPPDADPDLLVRAARRCAALAAQLSATEVALDGAAGADGMRWSGIAAAMFRAGVAEHRRSVADTRRTVEHLGALIRAFGHEVADAQARARSTAHCDGGRPAIPDELAVATARFRSELWSVESALTQIRLRLAPPGRWTGPVRPPGSLGQRWLPVSPPGRWTGPVLPPGRDRHRVPLPAPARAAPVAAAPLSAGVPS